MFHLACAKSRKGFCNRRIFFAYCWETINACGLKRGLSAIAVESVIQFNQDRFNHHITL